jgi:uncharacterized membrane protein
MSQNEAKKSPNSDVQKSATSQLDPQEITKNVEAKVPSIKKLPQADKITMVETVVAQVAFSGPLPPPAMLDQYNRIEPGLADRIVAMAEKSLQHEQQVQSKMLDAEIEVSRRDHVYRMTGMNTAIVALCGMIILVGWLAYLGLPVLAGLFGASSIALIVWMFIQGRNDRSNDPPTVPSIPTQSSKKQKKNR